MKSFNNISRVVCAMTVQMGNILHMDKTVDFVLNELKSIFHTHRVEYPKLLSAQVLPTELKQLAIDRMENCKTTVNNNVNISEKLREYTINQLQYNINYLNARDQYHMWDDSIEFNRRLDVTRKQNLFEVNPEFKDYV